YICAHLFLTLIILRHPPRPTHSPYTTLFRSSDGRAGRARHGLDRGAGAARAQRQDARAHSHRRQALADDARGADAEGAGHRRLRSEEHTSELQSPYDLVCRLLLEKKNIAKID